MSPVPTPSSTRLRILDLLRELPLDDRLTVLTRVRQQTYREATLPQRRIRERGQYGLSTQEVGVLLGMNRNSVRRVLTKFGVIPVRGPRRGYYLSEAQFIDLRTRWKARTKANRLWKKRWTRPRDEVVATLRREFECVLERMDDPYNHSQRLQAFNEVKRRAPHRLQRLIVYVRGVPSIFNPDTMQRRGDLAVVLSRAARIERLLQRSRCDRSLFYSASSKTVSLDDPLGGSELTLMQVTPAQSVSPLDALIEQEKIAKIVQRLADTRGISPRLARELVERCLEGDERDATEAELCVRDREAPKPCIARHETLGDSLRTQRD